MRVGVVEGGEQPGQPQPGHALLHAHRQGPAQQPRTASTASFAARTPARVRSASTSRARPASVSRTLRVVRLNSGVRSSCSSARTEADRPDCDTATRSAARVKCRSSATATKCSSWRNSMIENPRP